MNCSLCQERIQKGWAYVRKYDVVCKDCKQSIVKKKKEAKEAARLAEEAKNKKKDPEKINVCISGSHLEQLCSVCSGYVASFGFQMHDKIEQYPQMDYLHQHFYVKFHPTDDYSPVYRHTHVAYNLYKNLHLNFKKDPKAVAEVNKKHPIYYGYDCDSYLSHIDNENAMFDVPYDGQLTQQEIDHGMELTLEQISIYEFLLDQQNRFRKLRRKKKTVIPEGHESIYIENKNNVCRESRLYVSRHIDPNDCCLEISKVLRENGMVPYWRLDIDNTDSEGDKYTIEKLSNKLCGLQSLYQWLENQ